MTAPTPRHVQRVGVGMAAIRITLLSPSWKTPTAASIVLPLGAFGSGKANQVVYHLKMN